MKRSINSISFLAIILLAISGIVVAVEDSKPAEENVVDIAAILVAPEPNDAAAETPDANAPSEEPIELKPRKEPTLVKIEKIMPEQVEVDKPFTYTLKLTSITASEVPNVVVTEIISPNFDFQEASPEASKQGNKLVWEFDELWPKASREITITGVATSTESLEHHTTVVTHLDATSAVTIVVEPKLELILAELPEKVSMGEPFVAKFTVSNPGTGSVANVMVTSELPEGVTTVDGLTELSFDANDLDADQSREFTAELVSVSAAEYAIKGKAVSAGGLEAESEEASTTVIQPVITLAKIGPDAQHIGRVVTYEMTVTNVGEVATLDTAVEEALPETGAVTNIKATTGAKMTRNKKILWELGTLEPGDSRTVKISYMPSIEGVLASNSIATAKYAEAVTASAETELNGIPGILLEVIDVEDPIELGQRCTYIIKVENQGSAIASNISVICDLEKAVKYVYSTGATVGTQRGRRVTFAPYALAPKTKATWRVVVTAEEPGDSLFKVTLTTDEINRTVNETEATHVYE